jgi:hypothetical protein
MSARTTYLSEGKGGEMSRRLPGSWIAGAALLISALCASGCDYSETRRENLHSRLISLRSERTALLDALYKDYGGGTLLRSLREEAPEAEVPQDPKAEAPEVPEDAILDFVRGLVAEGDRSLFEEQARVVGRGDRPVTLTSRDREFFSRDPVKARCRQVVELDYKIERMERKLADSERQPAPDAPGS